MMSAKESEQLHTCTQVATHAVQVSLSDISYSYLEQIHQLAG